MISDTQIDISKSHEEFEAKVKNLQGMFNKIKGIFHVSEYVDELNAIVDEVSNNERLKEDKGVFEVDINYNILKKYIDRVDELTKKIDEEYIPFYEVYLLSSKIDSMLSSVTAENIDEIIKDTKTLLELIYGLNHEGKAERIKIIEDAYRSIYGVLLHEEVFKLSTVLDYINDKNRNMDRENLGRLIEKDFTKLDIKDILSEELKGVEKDGLGYDYLSNEFIRKLSEKVVGNPNSAYQERKSEAIENLSSKVADILSQKDMVMDQRKQTNGELRTLRFSMAKVHVKIISFALIPVMTFCAGKGIGRIISNNITEYKAITRTVNEKTKELIGEPEITWEEQKTAYVASVTVNTPWRKNPAGLGYIRNATVYEYITPDDAPEDYHLKAEDLENNVIEKYGYIEPKDNLDETDSLIDGEILITETYDGKETRKSTKFVWPGAIIGSIGGIAVQVILGLLLSNNGLGVYEIKRILKDLDEKIRDKKTTKKELIEELRKIQNKVQELGLEYNDLVKKYNLDDKALPIEIDELDLSSKKRRGL